VSSGSGVISGAELLNVNVNRGWNSFTTTNANNFRPTGSMSNHENSQCMTWQRKDTAQKDQAAKFEAEQIKLFGGMPGDDVGLCYRMLEYFGGLDFIDT